VERGSTVDQAKRGIQGFLRIRRGRINKSDAGGKGDHVSIQGKKINRVLVARKTHLVLRSANKNRRNSNDGLANKESFRSHCESSRLNRVVLKKKSDYPSLKFTLGWMTKV